ncbi:MAG: glutamine-hydrolyzing carbamoyl-phosphate synthase small subunit [Proteobacteria bacterium]|nr:glutamine-hydrolyzing carbamoyl-phosphate synthase small subunit [Pseudomonadota bacterium]
MKALLALEDGRVFSCRSFTGPGEAFGEVVFNTGMTGYQEVLTDPSYRGQMVAMTYPLVGCYGTNEEDVESDRIQVSAFLVREYQEHPNNFRSSATLKDYLRSQGVLGVEGFDTRALTRHIREKGAMRGGISSLDTDPASLVARVRATPSMAGLDLATAVSTEKPYFFENGRPGPLMEAFPEAPAWRMRGEKKAVVAFDFGVKYNILRCLEDVGCEVLVVPARTTAEQVRALSPDGVFLANGPGDPEPLDYAIRTIRDLLDFRPLFGICLGHQLLGLALGGKTYKLKFGHRGVNQPVKDLATGRVEITSQNHGFAVDSDSLPKSEARLTQVNLNDNTCEAFDHISLPVFAAQYHPEANPGPHDARHLFSRFARMMEERGK